MTSVQGIGSGVTIALPAPVLDGGVPVEAALASRRSKRSYDRTALTLDDISQLLWSAQGITSPHGWRTAPSAGALYPLEIDVLCGNVAEVSAGIYRYRPKAHALELRRHGDLRDRLRRASLQQHQVADAAAVIVIVAVPGRSMPKYGIRAERYIHMETGHVAQNVYLQAGVLGLGTVVIGAFEDDRVGEVLGLVADEAPLALMPVGHPD